MAQELTIQAVEGMTNAVDKMSTAFKGLKTSIGSIKGTNALKELQAVVQGVNRLETALQNMDKGLGSALGKVIAQLESLPTNIANAMGSSARAAKSAGESIGKELADGVSKGAKNAEARIKELQYKADGIFRETVTKSAANRAEIQAKSDGIFRQAVRAAEEKALQEGLKALETRAAKEQAAQADFRAKSLGQGRLNVQNLQRMAKEELDARTAGNASLQAALKAMDDKTKLEADAQARYRATSLDQGKRNVKAIKQAVSDELEARKEGNQALQAALKAMEDRRQAEEALQARYRATTLEQGKRNVAAIKQAVAEELAARKAADAARMSALARVAKGQIGEAMGSAGSYTALTGSNTGQVVKPDMAPVNRGLKETVPAARAAGMSLQKLGIDANTTHSAMRGLASGFGLLWLTWGNLAPLLTGAAISNGFVQTIKMGVEVDKLLEQTRVLGEETAASMEKLEGRMLDLAKTGPYSIREVAEAIKTLTLAGLSADEVGDSLKSVLDFAIAGDTSIKLAAETTTSVATAFRLSAKEYGIVGDAIAKTAAVSKASVEDMAEAFKASTVMHKQYGASLTDVSVGLALLSNLGIKGSAAGVALRNMYVDLAGRTPKVRAAMKELGIEVLKQDGSFKSFVDVTRSVAEGLDRAATGTDKLRFKAEIMSERGLKPMIDALDKFRSKASDTSYANALDELVKAIENRAGFAGLAAAQLALTNANEIKGVFTTLQDSAMAAFNEVEPMIFYITRALKEAFSSKEFKGGLSTMITMVGSFTSFLVEHGKVLLTVAAAYVGLKSAMFISNMFAGMSQALSMATANLVAMRLAATGVGPAMTASAAATTTLGSAMTAVAARSGLATTALAGFATVGSRLLAFMAGPFGVAMAAAVTAYTLYAAAANKAADAKDRLGAEKSKSFVEGLNARTEETKKNIQALQSQEDLEVIKAQAEANVNLKESIQDLAKAKAKEAAAQADLARGNTRFNTATQDYERERAATYINGAKARLKVAAEERQAVELRMATEKKAVDEFIAAKREEARVSAELAEKRRKEMLETFGDVRFTDENDGGAGGKGPNDNALQQAEKAYRDKLDTISKFADNERKVLEAGHKSKFLSETEYAAKSLQLTLKTEADKLAAVKEARAKYLSEYDKIAPKLSGQDSINAQQSKATFMGVLTNDEATFKSDSATRIKIEAQDAAGMVKRLREEYAAFWEADKNRLNQKTAIKQFGEDFKGVAELAQTFSTAANSAAQAYAEPIKATTAELSRQQVELAALKSAMDQTTDPDQMEGLLARYYSLTKAVSLTTVQVDALKAAQTEMAKAAGIDAVIDKYLSLADNNPARGFDGAGKALAGFVNSIQQATRAWEMQREVVQGVEAAIQAAAKAQKEATDEKTRSEAAAREAKLTADLKKVRDAAAKAEVRNYANIAGAAKSFFKEKSTGYKIMEGLEKGFRAFELAMSVKSMFQSAVEWSTKVNAAAAGHSADVAMSNAAEAAKFPAKITGIFAAVSSQLGIFGPPVAAAIVAAIGLSAAGRSRGTFAPTNNGTGTVFGDSNAKSESVNNSIERLVDNSSIELTYSQGMLAALKNIEANIGGVTNQILRNQASNGSIADNVNQRTTVGLINSAEVNLTMAGAMLGGPLGAAIGAVVSKIPIVQKITQALFGSTTSVKGSGLYMGDQSLASINASGANLQEYADVNTKKKFFGITYSNKNSTITGAADEALSRQFALIFQSFYDALKLAATPLGKNLDDVTNRLNNFVVSIGKIDLQGLTGEQIQEKLTAVLGAAADNIAAAALPGFEAFQKVGEGYFETVVRVANGSEVAKLALDRLGIGMVNLGDLVNKQGDVATEVIRQSIANVETISGSLTGVGKIVSTFSGSSGELVEVYQALLAVRESMRSMGKDAMTLSIEMIKGAGGLEALQDGLQSYYDNYLTDQERLAAMTRRVTEQFQKAGVAMPTSIEGFKEMVKGQETVTASGQETFGKMMALADAFYKLQEAMGKTESSASAIAEERKSLEDRLKQAQDEYNKAALTSIEYAALQRSAINASNLALYDQVIALETQTASLLKAASERKALQDELNNLTLSEAQLNDIKRNALEESNRALFDQVQATKAQQAAATEAAAAAKKIADERYGLEGQLLNLQGKTAELRARELEKLAPENRELQKSIWALEDAAKANQAAQEAADAANQAAQEAADRARELREAWMDAGKGILEEVQRIRGATNNPGQNLAAAQTEFSLAVAKAQSGDVDAAKELPKLSQNLLKIAEESAASSSDLARIQSKTLATLERTLYYIENSKGVDIPGFASGGMHMGGVRVVGEDGPELEVTGPARIYNNAQLRQMMQGGQSNDKLAAELAEVKQLLATIAQDQRSYGGAIATHTASTAKVLRDVAPDRDAINIRNAAP